MTTPQETPDYIHRAAVDPEGNKIGKISQVYNDDQTGQPLWVRQVGTYAASPALLITTLS